jgi:hypothetical protein
VDRSCISMMCYAASTTVVTPTWFNNTVNSLSLISFVAIARELAGSKFIGSLNTVRDGIIYNRRCHQPQIIGIVLRDWGDLQIVSLDKFEVQTNFGIHLFFILIPFSY